MQQRLENLRASMAMAELDAVVVTKRENYMYLSGFTGTSAILVISRTKAFLVTDFRYTEQAAAQATGWEVVKQGDSAMASVSTILGDTGARKVGFEDRSVTVDRFEDMKKRFAGMELAGVGTLIEDLRMIKDASEIEKIRAAAKLADDCFAHLTTILRPGIAEFEVAAEIDYFFRRHGALGTSFDSIVASGRRSSLPHGVASVKKIEQGDAVTLDYGAYLGYYCSDMTRTVFIGKPDDQMATVYQTVLKAQLAAIEAIREGAHGKDVDAVARQLIADAGFAGRFGHGLGHGVGLEIHEDPRLSPLGKHELKANMCVTVEPGIYLEGIGGVRIEDLLVVTKEGYENLTTSPKEMIIL